MQLSPHFSVDQLIHSDTAVELGISNWPDESALKNLARLAQTLEQVRTLLGHEIAINSGYRSPALNAAVGGAPRSQHVEGLAADFICPEYGTPLEIVLALARSAIVFDQCILEFSSWVHLSVSESPRERVLTINSSRQGYLEGLWDQKGNRWA